MIMDTLQRELEEGLAEMSILDVHTHLVGGRLAARGLHDILLYHMVVSDLYGAGCPSGSRLTEFPSWPDEAEAHRRIEEAIPYLPRIRNTSTWWLVRLILKDLYAWETPITAENWRGLDDLIRERADDRVWQHSILDRAHIRRTGAEYARRGQGADDERLQYSLEWGFFTRTQWGEFDTALYELERCWGRQPAGSVPIGAGPRPPTDRTIRTLADVRAAIQYYVDTIPYPQLLSMATHLSTDIDYRLVSDSEIEAALARRPQAGLAERSLYAAYVHEAFLTALEPHAAELVFQFSLGAEPLPFETGSRLSQTTLAQLADMIARHPRLRFQCLLASRHANQTICTMARELPNFSLAGYWWHNFFPSAVTQLIDERLDSVPANKQIAFFSDAYCVEWSYGKWRLVRKLLAGALAARVERGQYTIADALSIARTILYESPQSLLGMQPRPAPGG
jgi:glucuronate isomerase